jgi:phosphate/sulfate permease
LEFKGVLHFTFEAARAAQVRHLLENMPCFPRRPANWLLADALWLNFATAVGAPVSTTHFIVGAILGAGIAAGGLGAANWGPLGGIVASWVISPVLGGVVAAARRTVPIR